MSVPDASDALPPPVKLDAVDRDPEAAFGALPGMGAKGATRAADSWRERRALRELYLLLAPHGAGWLASQLHETHGPGAAGVNIASNSSNTPSSAALRVALPASARV